MGKFKGSKGPWSFDGNRNGLVQCKDRELLALVYPAGSERSYKHLEMKANANLISAAPELLEALQGLLIRIADDEEYGPDHAITKARQAIAKALGE